MNSGIHTFAPVISHPVSPPHGRPRTRTGSLPLMICTRKSLASPLQGYEPLSHHFSFSGSHGQKKHETVVQHCKDKDETGRSGGKGQESFFKSPQNNHNTGLCWFCVELQCQDTRKLGWFFEIIAPAEAGHVQLGSHDSLGGILFALPAEEELK